MADSEMLRRAATACRNVTNEEWFGWVPTYLDSLADRLDPLTGQVAPADDAAIDDIEHDEGGSGCCARGFCGPERQARFTPGAASSSPIPRDPEPPTEETP